jgi:hypothetical protein
MMIPGQWEPRRPSAVTEGAAAAPAVAAGTWRDPNPPIRRRREMATWLEVTIVVIALLATMFLAMWASRYDARQVLGHPASEDVASPVQHVVPV